MIFVIDDDKAMAKCIAKACSGKEVEIFGDGIKAMGAISQGRIPSLIFLDILLDGPDGFTLINELVSYPDTEQIPIVVVSSLMFKEKDLKAYGVVGALNKDTMTPDEIRRYADEYD